MNPQPAFRALSDPTRRGILQILSTQDMTISEVTQNFDMTRAAIKKHLNILKQGDLITVRVKGRESINALNPEGIKPILGWLEFFDQFWDDRLTNLKSAIENKEITHD